MNVKCDYCGVNTTLRSGAELYPQRPDLASLRFYVCTDCCAWVGCHKGTVKPLGRLANAELRAAKSAAHRAFDPLWKDGNRKRKEAYGWLAYKLGINFRDCHIGMFDLEMCQRVIEVCNTSK